MRLEGQQIGRYRFERLIGRGGMGEVYLAVDPRIQQQVAVKVLQAETEAYPMRNMVNEAERFRREASAIANLRHRNIVPLFDYNEASIEEMSLTYLVIPYYKDGSFATWLHQRGSDLLPMEDVAYFVQQAATALQYAHEQHIIHRDVKPTNFLIDSSENPNRPNLLLTDFGISKFGMTGTAGTQSLGTLTYEPPEQLQGHPTYASDQYALAIMAYELLVGRPPFEGPPPVVIRAHMEEQPQPPSFLNTRVPRAVDHVLLRALDKKPENRYASIAEFARALQQALPKTGEIPQQQAESRNREPQGGSVIREPQKESRSDPEANKETFVRKPQSPASPVLPASSTPIPPRMPPNVGAFASGTPSPYAGGGYGMPQGGYAPSPPAPAQVTVQKSSRRGLWITLGAIVSVLLLGAIVFGVIGYVNRSTPTKTLNAFCSALQSGDFQTAYDQRSSSLQAKDGSEAQFAADFSNNGGLGRVTGCAVSNVDDGAGTGTITYTLAGASTVVADYSLVNENGAWKINAQNIRPTPSLTLFTFCNTLRSQDYQTAYNQLSSSAQGQIGTEAQFAANFNSVKVTGCTVSNVNDTAGTGTITYNFSNGSSEVDDYTLVLENGAWKINSGQKRP